MGTTADKLNAVLASKNAIRDAITEKTGEDAGEVMSTYAEKIRSIEGGQKFYTTTILIDQTITDPATMITKVYDDGGIAMIRANSHRYVCKLVYGVMQAKQLQDNNGTLYLDGSPADLTGGEGDVMMKLPKFYWRVQSQTNEFIVDFVYGEKPSDDYSEWDGKDFIGVYEAYVDGGNAYSRSGVASAGNLSQVDFKSYARARGVGYTLVKWKHHCIMAFLFYAFYSNTNSQDICGSGTSSQKNTGQTDLLGMEDTVANVNGNTQSVNFWGLENWWGNKYEWVDNVDISNRKWNITSDDGSTKSINAPATNGYISKMTIDEHLNLVGKEVAGTESSGYSDYYAQTSGDGLGALISGTINEPYGGISAHFGAVKTTVGGAAYGSRLAYRGEYNEFSGVFSAEYSEAPFTSNGSQYFDTGFKHNQDTRVVMRVKANGTPTTNAFFFDGRSGSKTRKAVFYYLSRKTLACDYGEDSSRQTYSDVSITDFLLIDYDKNICTINDEVKEFTKETFQSSSSLVLLASNYLEDVSNPIAATLYSCQIYDNGTLIRDYVPCVRKSDGVSGLWDKVNKTFVTPTSI